MVDVIIYDVGDIYNSRKQYIEESGCKVVEMWEDEEVLLGASDLIGTTIDGIEVVRPHHDFDADKIVICNDLFYDIITDQLVNEYGVPEEKLTGYWFFEERLLTDRYKDSNDREIHGILDYIGRNRVEMFNYGWADAYRWEDIEVNKDKSIGMNYVMYMGKRMYMNKLLSKRKRFTQEYVRSLLVEQDTKSPHFYWKEHDWKDEVVIDLGVAEGNFTLSIIDQVKHVFLVETDPEWIEALKVTYADYMDKVTIIDKFVSDNDEGNCITLESILSQVSDYKNQKITIKMDIEGAEEQVLENSLDTLSEIDNLYMLICTYHHSDAYDDICRMLSEHNFDYETSDGYMYMPVYNDSDRVQRKGKKNSTDFRKALVYVKNNRSNNHE